MKKWLLLFFISFSLFSLSFGQDHTDQKKVDPLSSPAKKQVDPDVQARMYYDLGLQQENLSHIDSAIDYYTQSIALNPEAGRAYFKRGGLFERKHNFAAAIKDDEMAAAIYGDNKPRQAYLYGRIGLMQWGLKNYKEALKADSVAIQLNPNDSFAWVNLGFAHFAVKQYEMAIKDFTIGIPGYLKDTSKLSIIVTGKANAERNFGKYQDAIKDYLHALDIDPRNNPARWNLALSYKLNGDYGLAHTEYDKTIDLFKSDDIDLAKLHDEKAELEIEERKYAEALHDATLAISFNSKYGDGYTDRGNIYMQTADFLPAIESYRQALIYNKADSSISSSLLGAIAKTYYFLGQYNKSIAASDSAINLNSTLWRNYFVRGRGYLKIDNKVKARADFDKILALDTSKSSYEYAYVLYYTGHADQALKTIVTNIESTKNIFMIGSNYYNLACLFALMKNYREANSYLKKAIDMGLSKRYALADPDFENIKNTPEFLEIVK